MPVRTPKRIVIDVVSSVVVLAAAVAVMTVKVNQAMAQTTPDDENRPSSTEAIAQTPDAAPQNLTAEERDRRLLAEAVKPRSQGPEIRWSDAGDAVSNWASPTLGSAERFATRYEPRFNFSVVQHNGESQAQIQVALGDTERPAPVKPQQVRLGAARAPVAIAKPKGHWYLFAAGGSNAVGMNLLRDTSGELKRAGWTFEHVAAIGTGQAGIGWRKGPLQASLGLVERQLSSYGQTVHQQFLAFTISITPQGIRTGGAPQHTWVERDDHYRGRYNQH